MIGFPLFFILLQINLVKTNFFEHLSKHKKMKYLVATFRIEAQEDLMQACRDLLADGAAEAGFESFEDTPQGVEAYVQKDLFDKEELDAYLQDFPIEDAKIDYDIKDAEDKDWNQEWEEQGFEPIYVGDQVVIYDAKHPELYPDTSNRPDIIEIGIEAKLAFGTGNHQTTRMIIGQLLQMPIKTKRVLDCGTGTGILGLTASKLGAKEVVGYDIDEWSVENAKHNAVLNGVENMEVLFGNSQVLNHVSGVFDVVMANINRNILLEDMKLFRSVMNVGATLILSGFYEEDVPVLLEKAEELGLKEKTRMVDENWTCLVLGS